MSNIFHQIHYADASSKQAEQRIIALMEKLPDLRKISFLSNEDLAILNSDPDDEKENFNFYLSTLTDTKLLERLAEFEYPMAQVFLGYECGIKGDYQTADLLFKKAFKNPITLPGFYKIIQEHKASVLKKLQQSRIFMAPVRAGGELFRRLNILNQIRRDSLIAQLDFWGCLPKKDQFIHTGYLFQQLPCLYENMQIPDKEIKIINNLNGGFARLCFNHNETIQQQTVSNGYPVIQVLYAQKLARYKNYPAAQRLVEDTLKNPHARESVIDRALDLFNFIKTRA